MAQTQILFKCFSAKQWNNLWILHHGSLQEPELSRFPENAIMAGAGVNEPSETATAWEDHCSDFFIVIPMPFSKYLAISKLMQIDNSCYPRDQTLNPSCVWQGWVVTHWVFGTDHSSCDQYPTGLWSLLGSVLGILQPALPWNICTQPELNSCAVLPPARTEVLSLSQWVASLGHSKAQLPELVMVSGTASFFHTFSGEIILIRFEFWPLILTLFSPAWTWLEIFLYKTPYSLATLYEGKWLIK